MNSLQIINGTIVLDEQLLQSDLTIQDGVITALGNSQQSTTEHTIDATGLLIFPGFIDCHVHFRDPGMEEAETMVTGGAAARAGGVTTVCDMPNTSPPTCTVHALNNKLHKARSIRECDIRLFFGITSSAHLDELRKVGQPDICGVKLYLGHSTGNQKIEEGIEEEVFKLCSKKNLPLVCHCEDQETINRNTSKNTYTEISAHSSIRSVDAALKATTHAIALAAKYDTKLHIAHVSTKEELEIITAAKTNGQPVTCEVAPHHLFLSIDDYDHLGTLAKMNPPLRSADHCDALWQGVLSGAVDCIATDHAPHTLFAKQTKPPLTAPSGVPGVETLVPLLLNADLPPQALRRLCFTNPNRIFALGKPDIALGKPANLALVNPSQTWTIRATELKSKCGWTPYEGWEVRGNVVQVI